MHASCSICGDIFTGLDAEVLHSTPCGHIFHYVCLIEWLQRSKTCPHCRAKVDERKTIKLYFQLSNFPVKDSGTLENEVQSLKFQLSMKDIDLKKLSEETIEAKAINKGLRSKLLKREEEIRTHETVVSALQDQIKILKIQMKSLTEAQARADELQNKLQQYENIEKILKGSTTDAADALALMKDVSDSSILCSCISALKKELYQHKEKARDLQNLLKIKETRLASAVAEISRLEKQISILDRALIKVKEDLTYTENENENLKKTCKRLEEAIISPSGSESSSSNPRDKALRRFINEYPTPHLKSTPSIDLNITTVSNPTKHDGSPTSPIRLHGEMKHKSLLNKRRLITKSTSDSDMQCYDGLGGHVKEVIRTDRATLLNAISNSKKVLPGPSKRAKFGSGSSAQKSDLLKFCVKKT